MRCATTWTFACLQQHPDIAFPAGKQIHFWDQHRESGLDWYRDLFDPTSPIAEGEITPAYALLEPAAVAEVKAFAPDLRVWFVMRHPIDRAWSSVRLYLRREDIDPATLDDEWFRDRLTRRSIVMRNAYAETLRVWRSEFGDAVLALPYSMVATAPGAFLGQIAKHIGVDSAPFLTPTPEMAAEMAEVRNVGVDLALPAHLLELTQEFYADEIAWFESEVSESSV